MVMTDIQDYWRQRWGGDRAIPQDNTADGKSRLYGGEGEAAVVWSGTDVVYAKQRENLVKGNYSVSSESLTNKNNDAYKIATYRKLNTPYAIISVSLVKGDVVSLSFDVSDYNANRLTLFKITEEGNYTPFNGVGHYCMTFVVSKDRTSLVLGLKEGMREDTPWYEEGGWCIIKNIKLEKNIVDSQYSVAPSVTDNRVKIGTHWYHTTQIGNLIWTAENLNEDLGGGTWEGYYNNDPTYGVKGYGKLYTWDAICKANETPSDALAAILPAGWRVPTNSDFATLVSSIGSSNAAKIKEKWYWNEGAGTNDAGFSGIAGGCSLNKLFANIGVGGYFWTSSETSSTSANTRYIDTGNAILNGTPSKTNYAASVRLVRDAAT